MNDAPITYTFLCQRGTVSPSSSRIGYLSCTPICPATFVPTPICTVSFTPFCLTNMPGKPRHGPSLSDSVTRSVLSLCMVNSVCRWWSQTIGDDRWLLGLWCITVNGFHQSQQTFLQMLLLHWVPVTGLWWIYRSVHHPTSNRSLIIPGGGSRKMLSRIEYSFIVFCDLLVEEADCSPHCLSTAAVLTSLFPSDLGPPDRVNVYYQAENGPWLSNKP